MEIIYKIERMITLNPYENNDKIIESLDVFISSRIKGYINERLEKWEFSHPREFYRFYFLSEKEQVSLPHLPRPKVNNPGAGYYSLAELQSGELFVVVESWKSKNPLK